MSEKDSLSNLNGCPGRESPFTPAHLLWLIQRDFLEGKSVQQMSNIPSVKKLGLLGAIDDQYDRVARSWDPQVKQALKLVPNPNEEKALDQVNRIRKSLVQISRNSTAFGLRQPHLQRTKLCELNDRDLDRVRLVGGQEGVIREVRRGSGGG
eukprot:416070-Prorocentrum_minimum.AAC.1